MQNNSKIAQFASLFRKGEALLYNAIFSFLRAQDCLLNVTSCNVVQAITSQQSCAWLRSCERGFFVSLSFIQTEALKETLYNAIFSFLRAQDCLLNFMECGGAQGIDSQQSCAWLRSCERGIFCFLVFYSN